MRAADQARAAARRRVAAAAPTAATASSPTRPTIKPTISATDAEAGDGARTQAPADADVLEPIEDDVLAATTKPGTQAQAAAVPDSGGASDPAGQGAQAAGEPGAPYEPAPQGAQKVEPLGAVVPTGQGTHALPLEDRYWPAAQGATAAPPASV